MKIQSVSKQGDGFLQVKIKLEWFAYSTGMKEDEEAVMRWQFHPIFFVLLHPIHTRIHTSSYIFDVFVLDTVSHNWNAQETSSNKMHRSKGDSSR